MIAHKDAFLREERKLYYRHAHVRGREIDAFSTGFHGLLSITSKD
jgi:hypothetical protein